MKQQDLTARFIKGYRGPRSLAAICLAIASYCRQGAQDAGFEQRRSCMIAWLSRTVYVCGQPSPLARRRIEATARACDAAAVFSASPLTLDGYTARTVQEMRYAGDAEAARPTADLVTAVRIIHSVSGVAADRLLVEYLRRTSAGVAALFLAEQDGRPAAAAAADFICPGYAVIGSVSVPPLHRGNRLGLRLAAAAAAGYRNAYLICEKQLVHAYAAEGFVPSAVLTISYKDSR